MSVEEVRAKFPQGTKIMVAIGGWGDTFGFSAAALAEETRRAFAEGVARMVSDTGADGSSQSFSPRGNTADTSLNT
jgi:GH18 family chitinase